jgi:hypothetical protein
VNRLTDDEAGILISAAGAAPSMHNVQPWRFAIVGTVVDVLLDPDRALPAEDPTGRLTLVGLGAAVLNLRVAAAMLGYEAAIVAEPDPARPQIAVRLFLEERRGQVAPARLYPELHRRHTHRGPMLDVPVAPRTLDRLADAVRAEGGELVWLGTDDTERLLGLVLEAEVLDQADEPRRLERARWVGGDRDDDGVPQRALGPRPAAFPAAYRDLAGDDEDAERETAVFEDKPLLAVLVTTGDGPRDWLDAGLALQHGLLTASSCDLAASFVNQPLEHPETRRYVRELIARAGHPQLILRLGYPSGHGDHAPRRPWRDLVEP